MGKIKVYLKKHSKEMLVIPLVIFLIALRIDSLSMPFYWDDIAMGIAIKGFQDKPFQVISEDANLVHSTLLPTILGTISTITGYNLKAFHMIILIFGAVGLYYMFLLSELIFQKKLIALVSVVILASIPAFFAFLGRIYYDIPLTTLSIMSFYYLFKGRYLRFTVLSTVGILTKEIFVLILPAAFAWMIFKEKKKLYYLILPLLVFVLWAFAALLLYPKNVESVISSFFPPITSSTFSEWLTFIRVSLFWNGLFMLTVPVTIIYTLHMLASKKTDKEDYVLYFYIATYFVFLFFSGRFSGICFLFTLQS